MQYKTSENIQNQNRRHNFRNNKNSEQKKYDKGLIIIKSLVFALSIVLVVLLVAFLIIKNQKENSNSATLKECEKNINISNVGEIENFAVEDGVITLLTKKDANKKQQIIRIDSNCGHELSRINFSQ